MSWLVHCWLLSYGITLLVFKDCQCRLLKYVCSLDMDSSTINNTGKICDKALLKDRRTFPNKIFSGSGGSNYQNARFTGLGWCASSSGSYLLLDLQKEYHITRVVVMGDRDQTKWGGSYSLKYSHDTSYRNSEQIKGNQNGCQSATTNVDIYNARYIKIESTGSADFCLRIELCGEVQTPAPVYDIKVTPSRTSAQVTMGNPPAPETSSYIKYYIIYFGKRLAGTLRRQTDGVRFNITGLKPYTNYIVGIWAEDGSQQRSSIKYKEFMTMEAAPSRPPWKVAFRYRSKDRVKISWEAPSKGSWNGNLIGYKVCYSDKARSSNASCILKIPQLYVSLHTMVIRNLRPATKYFVTVAAGTSSGYGNKSTEISKITNGDPVNPVPTSYSSLNLTITRPAQYIKKVMVIAQVATESRLKVRHIDTNMLKPYQANTMDPYITACIKADVLPLTFVIGDGKEYNFENMNYFNRPLKQNSSYFVFLRFFENQDSYYSTGWSKSVKTFAKPPGPPLNVAFKSRGKTSLKVSWNAPEESSILTGYQVCLNIRYTAPKCLVLKSNKELSVALSNLRPSTKYYVTVAANSSVGFGEKSLEISRITNGEPVTPLSTSYYTLSLNIPKSDDYIRGVMVIVQIVTSSQTPSENIKTSELKPYQSNTQDPYITAYLKANVLPLTFPIGDGKEYNSETEKYLNQPLKQNSNYIVFLRYFESQDSYYSTEWSNSVKTMSKPPEEYLCDGETSSQSCENKKTCLHLLIPLVILAPCFLFSLAVNLYYRCRFQSSNKNANIKPRILRQNEQKGKFEHSYGNNMIMIVKASQRHSYVNDDNVYATPENSIKCSDRNEAKSKPEISTGEEHSMYMSLKDNKEPENVYQSLQNPVTSPQSTCIIQ